jgi:Helix-turn-helix domain of resolvase
VILQRDLGRPLAASDAQCAQVRKLRKAKMSLREIAEETSLSLQTVRTIIGCEARSDRTSVKRLQKVDPDHAAVTAWKARKRTRDALPRRINETLAEGVALLLDVTAIYTAANTTSPQQVTTLHTDRVLPHCPIRTEVLPEQTVRFVPPKVGGGDADYAGHGPCVDFRLALRLEDGNKTLAAHYRMHAFECDSSGTPRSDFTTAKGEEELILMVASPRGRILGYNVNSTKSQSYIDTNHSNDDFDYSDPTSILFDPVSPVKKLSFVGDTAGDEAGTKTGAFITFPAMRVELETCTPARPTAQSLTAPSRP